MSVTEGLVEEFGYGLGYQDFLDVAAPAAGVNVSVTVDGRWDLRVIAALATLDTDANAANRLLSLDFIDSRGITRVRNAASVLITANATAQAFVWRRNQTVAEWNTGTPIFAPVLDLFLPPGYLVQFTVDNVQVGDQLSALSLVVEKFPTGAHGYPQGVVAVPRAPRRRAVAR